MTVTLDGKTLNVRSLSEDFKVLNSQSDGWQSGAYARKIKPIGIIRVWTVECFENAVAWASCQAKSFEDTGQAGSTVTFAITNEARVLNTTVLILGVTIGPLQDLGGKNIRGFTLTLQETTYTLAGGVIAAPISTPYVMVDPTSVADLKAKIAVYGGKKTLVLPYDATGMTIDENIDISVPGFHLVNYPPRSCPITLTENGYFNILNGSSDWNTKSWYFDDLLIEGDGVATRAITTENGTDSKRTYQPRIRGCRFNGFEAANAIVINLKDVECGYIEKNIIFRLSSTGKAIRLYNTGIRQIGNTHITENEIFVAYGATGGIGVEIDGSIGSTGQLGFVWSRDNHFVGDGGLTPYDSLAINIKSSLTNPVKCINSNVDRFENCRVLMTDATGAAGKIDNVMIADMNHQSPGVAAITTPHVMISTACRRVLIDRGNSAKSGSDNVATVFCHNDAVSTNSQYSSIKNMLFVWVKTVGANNSYLINDGAIDVKHCWASDGIIADLP